MTVGELYVLFGLQVDRKSWGEGMGMLNGLKRAATGLLAGLGVRAITHLVEHTTEAATHLVSLSQAMGMTIEQTQEWGYVAQQSGSNLKELSVGVNMFLRNLRLYSEGRGSKVLRDRFREIKLSSDDAKAALASPDGLQNALFKTSDALKGMGGNGREATFTQLFGVRAGRAMLADLARGREGLEELMQRRRAMGELSKDDALGLRELGNRIKDVKMSFEALAAQVVARLAPQLLELAEAAAKWISENRDLLTGALANAIRLVAAGFEAVGAVISWITDLIHSAMGGDDGAEAILIGIAVAIATFVIPALWGMAAPILAATWPFLAIAAAAALVAYGILKLIEYAPQIGEALGNAWEAVKDTARDAWEYLVGLWDRFLETMRNLGHDLIEAFHNAWETIKEEAAAALDWISRKSREIPILGWLGEKLGEGAGALTNLFTGDRHLDGIDEIHTAPSALLGGGGGSTDNSSSANVNVGPTTVHINVNSVEEAKQAHEAFDQERTDNALRHAVRDVGGDVQ
jgi:hypothetical protein